MKNKLRFSSILLITILLGCAWKMYVDTRPTIYLIGDSTVRNGQGDGQGKGANGLWGWGNYLSSYFDTTKIVIKNKAMGGTSSRTYQYKLWINVLQSLKPGDYVIMQFGHNDNGALADSSRARGTIKGIGSDSAEIHNPLTKQQEIVHTYGWYIRKFISDTRSKGAIPVVCSPIPRNDWRDGKVRADSSAYGLWAMQVAQAENVAFIPLNKIIVNHYNDMGEAKARYTFFSEKDHTHTIEAGAKFNAGCVVEGLKELKDFSLTKYLLK